MSLCRRLHGHYFQHRMHALYILQYYDRVLDARRLTLDALGGTVAGGRGGGGEGGQRHSRNPTGGWALLQIACVTPDCPLPQAPSPQPPGVERRRRRRKARLRKSATQPDPGACSSLVRHLPRVTCDQPVTSLPCKRPRSMATTKLPGADPVSRASQDAFRSRITAHRDQEGRVGDE